MHRSERLDLILRKLVDKPGITAKELCRGLRISERSLYRDLNLLRKRGHPIEGAVGRGGGLRLHPSWGLGRVALSVEQSLGTLLALAIAEKLRFPLFHAELRAARFKIAASFSSSQRLFIRKLQDRVFVGEPASAAVRAGYGAPDMKVMKLLEKAIITEQVLQIEYVSERAEVSIRLIEPHAVFVNWPAWYVLAIDRTKQAPRTFRSDRIVKAVILSTKFNPAPGELFEQMVGRHFGTSL